MTTREHPMPGQLLMQVSQFDDYASEQRVITNSLDEANVATSYVAETLFTDGQHKPVLDLDFPARLVPSSTPGHFHLYLDRAMPWEDYARLLNVMAEVGLLEPGYVSASLERQHTAVRLPWVRKHVTTDGLAGDADVMAAPVQTRILPPLPCPNGGLGWCDCDGPICEALPVPGND